jgi:hypothetical protein
MAATSKLFVKNTVDGVNQAMAGVRHLVDEVRAARSANDIMTTYMQKIAAYTKPNPGKTIGELEGAIPEMKKLVAVWTFENDKFSDIVLKFDDTVPATRAAIHHAEKIIDDFKKHCDEKATHWNPLRKKSLGGNLRVIAKAKADMATINAKFDKFETHAKALHILS